MPPLGRLGVPTQTSARSVYRIAAATSVVADRRPAAIWRPIISPTPFSMTGVVPALTRSTLSRSLSTPITSWPSSARQAAETVPT